jgi:uncharacterized surface protein with fasciclin (FAS1) repeats|uniref:fasciclin domain-containing protein n=1 Tax=Altererythrobacter segetis TaxID=1104773 RepID=UPI00140DAABF|nr:fasciclin domain-containing protein [Altererythrobacter segetis]
MTIAQALRRPLAIAVAAALLPLAACSNNSDKADSEKTATPEPSGDTLAEAMSKQDSLSTLTGALRDTGLSEVFDNAGSYTIFAPTNDAFAKLGDAGKALRQADQRAVLTAVLRDHIVPGYLTPDDIGTAIDAEGGRVKVQTMGDHKLTFTRDGDGYLVAAEDGSTANIAGDATAASNGVAIPVDGVLKKL